MKNKKSLPNYLNILKDVEKNKSKFFKKPVKTKSMTELMKTYELTMPETNLFSVILNNFVEEGYSTSLKDLKKEYELSEEEYLKILKTCKSLVKKNMLVLSDRRRRSSEIINPDVEIDESVFSQLVLGEDSLADVDFKDMYSILEGVKNLYDSRDDEKISEKRFFNEFDRLFSKIYKELPIYSLLKKYDSTEQIMAMLSIADKITSDGEIDSQNFADEVFTTLKEKGQFVKRLFNNEYKIFKDKVLELDDESGFFSRPNFVISDKHYFKVIDSKKKRKTKKNEFKSEFITHLRHNSFKNTLYFDDEIKKHTDIISKASEKNQFKKVVKELKIHNLPTGLVMLLYGFPGTGKTATVYEIAKKTKRDVLQVNISQIKDKYVGESEKRLKSIFTDYNRAKEELKHTPILLFNEADSLIGKRISTTSSVDQMSNSMQNILLEELENFDGIFFATTNLLDNMDDAFDRRFLYKVKYDKPSAKIRKQIWQDKMKDLNEKELEILKKYDLSGGQIENISRKYLINSILNLEELSIDKLSELCRTETNFKKNNKTNYSNFGFRK